MRPGEREGERRSVDVERYGNMAEDHSYSRVVFNSKDHAYHGAISLDA